MSDKILAFQQELNNQSAEQVLAWALRHFGTKNIAFATSFGAEDQVITDMLAKIDKYADIFTLDTGLLPQETHEVLKETLARYSVTIEVFTPDTKALTRMVEEHGENLFYESVEKRKLCCHVRKVEPLKRKLSTLKSWICGLRREQSVTRTGVQKIEWDESFGLFKINPLVDWTDQQVWEYIKKHNIPYNALHDKGYPSIGCAPCTRAVRPGEDIRAGRWWWENAEHKECGLHKKVRTNNGSPG